MLPVSRAVVKNEEATSNGRGNMDLPRTVVASVWYAGGVASEGLRDILELVHRKGSLEDWKGRNERHGRR